jgi:hypothetical protein
MMMIPTATDAAASAGSVVASFVVSAEKRVSDQPNPAATAITVIVVAFPPSIAVKFSVHG